MSKKRIYRIPRYSNNKTTRVVRDLVSNDLKEAAEKLSSKGLLDNINPDVVFLKIAETFSTESLEFIGRHYTQLNYKMTLAIKEVIARRKGKYHVRVWKKPRSIFDF